MACAHLCINRVRFGRMPCAPTISRHNKKGAENILENSLRLCVSAVQPMLALLWFCDLSGARRFVNRVHDFALIDAVERTGASFSAA